MNDAATPARRTTGILGSFLLTSAARRRLHRSQRQRSLTIGVIEAIVVAGFFAAINLWFVPLLSLLGASKGLTALITTLTMAGPVMVGPFAIPLIRWCGGARRTATRTAYVQALAGMALAIPASHPDAAWALGLASVLALVQSVAGALCGAAWMTWMGTLIPPRVRGRYSGNRTTIFLACYCTCSLLLAVLSHSLAGFGTAWLLTLFFLIAGISRLLSAWCLAKQDEVPAMHREEGYRSAVLATPGPKGLFTFIRTMPDNDIGRWVLLSALIQVSAVLGGPFFQQWICRAEPEGLAMNTTAPFAYTVLMIMNPIVTVLVMPMVGWFIDRQGPTAVLRGGLVGVLLVPLGMLVWPTYPVLLAFEVVSAVSWCMVNSSVGVLLLSAHRDPIERSRLIGYHQTLFAGSQVATSLVGAWLIELVPPIAGTPYRTMFLISLILRIPVLILAIRWLPSLTFPAGDERRGLWRLIPGAEQVVGLGRNMWRSVVGSDD
jgi:MFS family permease